MAHYFDTSALAKLVVEEPETASLRSWLSGADRTPVSCDLARTELLRAVRRAAPDQILRAREVLEAIHLVTVSTAIFEQAGRLEPPSLRSLDALHLAAAIDLGDDLDAIVTYDDRQAAAARANGLTAISP